MAEIQEEKQVVTMTINDLIYTQMKELGKRMDRLEHRQDKLEEKLEITRQEFNSRMDKLDEKINTVRAELNSRMDKQDEKIEKLADKIDALHNEIKSSTGHISIANISTVAIAVGVLYSLFSK